MWTDDPIADFERYDREQQEYMQKLPRCSECDNHIQDDIAYYINDEWICFKCMEQYCRTVDADL